MNQKRIMKKTIKNKILTTMVVFMVVFGLTSPVFAQSPSLNVNPQTFSGFEGSSFNVLVGVNSSGEKICAVEGVIEFNNLSCQSIGLATGIMPQKSPTCTSPSFLIGIPQCTTENRNLFTVTVAGTSPGLASLSFSGVDIIGSGQSVSSESIEGNYTIATAPVVPVVEEPIPVEPEEPLEEDLDVEEPEVIEEDVEGDVEEEFEEIAEEEGFLLAAIGAIWDGVTKSTLLIVLIVLVIIAVLVFSIPSWRRAIKKDKNQ